ncbi:MAG: Rid family hydrolase [Actinomycetota bacterium]|nr:Rid family hydrolase [Actinomycetota bacterium]
MPVQTSNPEALHEPTTYSHVAVGTGNRMVFVAGQVALDPRGTLVGDGDVAQQAVQAYRNVAAALASVDAPIESVAKVTTFVVGHRPELLGPIGEARRAVFGDHMPASTLVGVQALARPEFLIEVEAVAVVD